MLLLAHSERGTEHFFPRPLTQSGGRGKNVAGRGAGFRILDAKPRRSAEAGQDSFPWPTTPIAARHMVAMVGEQGEVLCRSSPFGEDASGYAHLFELLGPPEGCLLALEATGHYWRNLFVALLAKGYAVAVLNPLRTWRFAEEELQRTKTDAIDALGIARFAAQKRPPATQLPDIATENCVNWHGCASGSRR